MGITENFIIMGNAGLSPSLALGRALAGDFPLGL